MLVKHRLGLKNRFNASQVLVKDLVMQSYRVVSKLQNVVYKSDHHF